MTVTIDSVPLAATDLGIHTLGQVLAYARRMNRLVTAVTIDGQEPAPTEIASLRTQPLEEAVVAIETVNPTEMARDVLAQLRTALDDADVQREQAVEALQLGDAATAMKLLGPCFTAWQQTQRAVADVAKLVNADEELLSVNGVGFTQHVNDFAQQLRDIKTAVERRDYVSLADVLAYEVPETLEVWRTMINRLSM